jgi:hypothetical protein
LAPLTDVLRSFPGLARTLNWKGYRSADDERSKKGSFKMSGQSNISRTLIAAIGALLMSSVAVGAAVGPAQAIATPVGSTLNA